MVEKPNRVQKTSITVLLAAVIALAVSSLPFGSAAAQTTIGGRIVGDGEGTMRDRCPLGVETPSTIHFEATYDEDGNVLSGFYSISGGEDRPIIGGTVTESINEYHLIGNAFSCTGQIFPGASSIGKTCGEGVDIVYAEPFKEGRYTGKVDCKVSSTPSDTTPPTVTASPGSGTYNTAQSVTLTSDEPATIYYTTDGSTPTTSSPSFTNTGTVSISNEGITNLKFFGVDTAGNKQDPIQTAQYVIDTTRPTVTASPASGTYNTAQSVTLTPSETATVYYSTDESPPSIVYQSPIGINTEGTTKLKFFAVDSAQNTGDLYTESYFIDTKPPEVTGAADRSPDSNGFYTKPVTIEWQGVDTEDGSGIASCDSPTPYSSPDAINIDLSGSCTDNAGNKGTATVTINYDANAPTSTTISSNIEQNGFTSSNTATFTLGGTDTVGVASYLCSIDGSGFESCPASVTYNGLSDGLHRFAAEAVDAAGHIDSTGAQHSWTVDTVKPVVSVPANIVVEATSSSGAQVSYSGATASDNLDGAITPTCVPPSGSMFPLGSTEVVCSAKDRAGNEGSASFYVTVQDTTPPTTEIASVSTGPNTVTFTLRGTDAVEVKSFLCSFDGSAFSACSSTQTYSGLRPGGHIFAASAVDGAGNTDQSPATWAGTIKNR